MLQSAVFFIYFFLFLLHGAPCLLSQFLSPLLSSLHCIGFFESCRPATPRLHATRVEPKCTNTGFNQVSSSFQGFLLFVCLISFHYSDTFYNLQLVTLKILPLNVSDCSWTFESFSGLGAEDKLQRVSLNRTKMIFRDLLEDIAVNSLFCHLE